jgi:hypothetical protein
MKMYTDIELYNINIFNTKYGMSHPIENCMQFVLKK